MSALHEVPHDLLRVLIVADWTCAVVIVLMAGRLAFLRAGEASAGRGLLTLRRPLAACSPLRANEDLGVDDQFRWAVQYPEQRDEPE
jgi:hypothetical protein